MLGTSNKVSFRDEEEHPGKHYKFTNKVKKGFTAAYPTQSSIPFKSQVAVIPEPEKKGFNSQSKRFYHKKDDVPGPGSYNVIHQFPVLNSVSLSKKGTCTFPSTEPGCPADNVGPTTKVASAEWEEPQDHCSEFHKDQRQQKCWSARLATIMSKYPAANAYTIPSNFTSKKDFSTSCSSMFQLPRFVRLGKPETPAPNHYNASTSFCKQKNNVCAQAGFLSRTPRGLLSVAETGPAPGHYNINESLVKQSPKILMSCFKSKTDRGFKVTSTGPGPGYYNPDDHIKVPKKTHIPRNPILNFSAQPLPLPPKPPPPGPGQYEIVNYEGPTKRFISSASFVSNTSRWAAGPSQPDLPGPATYKPELPGKQSFLYNEGNKWIPVM